VQICKLHPLGILTYLAVCAQTKIRMEFGDLTRLIYEACGWVP
jgi:hypothetical protein